MIVLWLLVAHLVGDYLLQTRWQAVEKFGWTRRAMQYRTRHVAAYCVPFIPISIVYGGFHLWIDWFLVDLALWHWLTDAQRFTRTPGEWLVWRVRAPRVAVDRIPMTGDPREPLPPNPWPTIGLAIDQTLHLVQIAVLASIFLTS